MKRTLVASLLFSFSLAAFAATPQSSISAPVRVTTGVTAPQLKDAAVVRIQGDNYLNSIPTPTTMLLHLSLDATGTPTRIQVVRSISPAVDAEVVRAVGQFHWKPARLDNRAVPSELDVHIQVRH
jgi:hypothetical protein